MKAIRSFAADATAIPAARRFVLGALSGLPKDVSDAISVMVSELAMNAVEFARTEFDVGMDIDGDRLLVEVVDAGGGIPEIQPAPPASVTRGRGLMIVNVLSDEWGVLPTQGGKGKSVWFRLALPPGWSSPVARSVEAVPQLT